MRKVIYTFAVLTLIVNISFAQLQTENLFKAPFISATNTEQSMQSVMQNSEKDIVFIENLGQIRDSKGNKIMGGIISKVTGALGLTADENAGMDSMAF